MHGFIDPDHKSSKHDEIQFWVYNNLLEVLKHFSSGDKTFEIYSRELEYPIIQTSQNYKSIVGFVDLYATGNVFIDNRNSLPQDADPEEKIKDLQRLYVSIEIKSEINSCGDLIRQINFYKRFEAYKSVWIVVSPDERFETILREQGIYFYKYRDPNLLF